MILSSRQTASTLRRDVAGTTAIDRPTARGTQSQREAPGDFGDYDKTVTLDERRSCGAYRGRVSSGSPWIVPRVLETDAQESVAAKLLGEQNLDAVDAFLDREEPLEAVQALVQVVVHAGDDVGDREHEVLVVSVERVEALVEFLLELLEALDGELFRHRVELRRVRQGGRRLSDGPCIVPRFQRRQVSRRSASCSRLRRAMSRSASCSGVSGRRARFR